MELARPKFRADASWIAPLAALAVLAAAAAVLDPVTSFFLVIAAVGFTVISLRPYLGVAGILTMFLIEYGERRGEAVGEIVTAGVGLLTINNVIGLFLAVLLVYHVYVERQWAFLRSRQVQILLLITAALLVSAALSPIDVGEMEMLGIERSGQNPVRLMVSRGLFVILFVAFVRRPRELRLMLGVFLILALASALAGFGNALVGAGFRAAAAESGFRAGGVAVLIEEARNPNRLALVCSLALAFVWEYGQSVWQRWRRVVSMGTVAMLILTVFLTASRGGVVGLAATGLFLLARRGQGARRVAYGALVALIATMLIAEFMPEPTAERLAALPGLSEETAEEGFGSIYRRRYGWQVAAEISAQNPFLGVGLANWEFERFSIDPKRITTPPHNSYLLTLAEGGILTLSLYLALFWVTLKNLREIESDPVAMRRARDDGVDWIVRGTRSAVMAYMVFSVFGDIWVLVSFYLLMGLSGALTRAYGPLQARTAAS